MTTTPQTIESTLARMMRARTEHDVPEGLDELSERLDGLIEAVEILARDHYDFPALPESRLRTAVARARRP